MRVHITRPLPLVAIQYLEQRGYRVTVPSDEAPPTRDALLQAVSKVDGILSILTEKIDSAVMEQSQALKVISNMAVGFDNIDLEQANQRKIAVCNTPGVLAETSADFAWALLMAVARRVVESDRFIRDGQFHWWGPQMLMGTDVHGSTLGIVGLGGIGKAVARRARGFGMEVVFYSPSAPEDSPWGRKVELEELLDCADFVSLHVPYKPQTHHLIAAPQLQLMKKTAFLINTSRGPVVKEEDLVEALTAKSIAGAGLDVFEKEPQVHPGLIGLDNVVMAPHVASASLATRSKMALLAAQNLDDFLSGRRPAHLVNSELFSDEDFTKAPTPSVENSSG